MARISTTNGKGAARSTKQNGESKLRSWAKSILWRVVGIFLLGGIAYQVTGRWEEMTVITVIFHSLRLVLYYFHERAWDRVEWGKASHPLGGIPMKADLTSEEVTDIEEKLRDLGYVDYRI